MEILESCFSLLRTEIWERQKWIDDVLFITLYGDERAVTTRMEEEIDIWTTFKMFRLKMDVIIDCFIIKKEKSQLNDVIFISAKLSINSTHLHWSK